MRFKTFFSSTRRPVPTEPGLLGWLTALSELDQSLAARLQVGFTKQIITRGALRATLYLKKIIYLEHIICNVKSGNCHLLQ